MLDHIPQSFARVVVSKALHHNIIDWAKLMSEKWRGKPSGSGPPSILHKGREGRMYLAFILQKLTDECNKEKRFCKELESKRIAAIERANLIWRRIATNSMRNADKKKLIL